MTGPKLGVVLIVAAGLFSSVDTGYDTASGLVTEGQRMISTKNRLKSDTFARCTLKGNPKHLGLVGNVI